MEALLLIALLMVAVDGPVTPSELSQDIQNGILAEDPVRVRPFGPVVQRSMGC